MSDDVVDTTGGRIVDSLTTMGEHFNDAAGDGIDPTAFAIDGAIAALDVLAFSDKPRFGKDHDINTTYDAAKDVYANGANWGRDAFGNTTPLRDAADLAGGMTATGLRGTGGGVKAYESDTEAEPAEERHDDE